MPQITFVDSNGLPLIVDAVEGQSLMEAGRNAGVEAIVAECGVCACATCHVYVPETWRELLPEIASAEDEMLEFVVDRHAGSRLSCQVVVTRGMDGMTVETPASQY